MEPLLSDELILEKSKIWSEAMKEFCEKENFEEIDYNDIKTESEENSDDEAPDETVIDNNNKNETKIDENENENKCRALVKVENFEGNTSSDDFEECTSRTMEMVKEHRERWEKNGMMKVLETFDWDQISKVVAPWVERNKLDKTVLSTSVDEQIVHIEEHHHRQVHMSSDDDSLHSLDTANYIRSSRKKKHTSCTTTTIKKFSYVKGSKRHLQKKYGFDLNKDLDLDKIFSQRYPESAEAIANRGLKAIAAPRLGTEASRKSFNCTPPTRPQKTEHEPWSLPTKRRKSRQMKRRSDVSKRSVSSSSSSSRSPARPLRPKFKRLSKTKNEDGVNRQAHKQQEKIKLNIPKNSKQKNFVEIDLTMADSSDSKSPTKASLISHPKEQHDLLKGSCQNATSSNETGFLGASIINSTALPTHNQAAIPDPIKKCQLTPIKNKPETQKQPQPAIKKLRVRLARSKAKQLQGVIESEECEELDVPKDPNGPEDPKKIQKPAKSEKTELTKVTEELEEIEETEDSKVPDDPKQPEEPQDPKKLEKPNEPKRANNSKELEKPNKLKEPKKSKEPKKPREPKKSREPTKLKNNKDRNDPKELTEPEKTSIPEDTSKVLLFSPSDLEPHRKNICGTRFLLTQNYFVEKVGKKNSRRFIKLNSKKFPFVFDCSSTISFKVPDESEESVSSDEDILYIYGREGKLLVETEEQKNNNLKR